MNIRDKSVVIDVMTVWPTRRLESTYRNDLRDKLGS